MSDAAPKNLTVEESALLDAGQWAGRVHAMDPVNAAAHLRGSISGLIHALGQIDGHAHAADFAEREAARQRTLHSYQNSGEASATLVTRAGPRDVVIRRISRAKNVVDISDFR